MTIVQSIRREDRTGIALLLAAGAGLLAPLCFLGYGTWPNIYMMLTAAQSTWLDHVPATSRPPGYWGYEAVLFATSHVGGYVLSNGLNLVVSLADIALVYLLAVRFRVAYPILCAALVAVNPMFVIEATSSQDFNLSLMGVLAGVLALDMRRTWLAALLFGLACALRLSTIVPIGAIYAASMLVHLRDRRALTQDVASAAAVVALFAMGCVVSYLLLGRDFYKGNLGPDEMWNATAWIGRFLYKVLYFFGGPVAALGALAAIVLSWFGRAAPASPAEAERSGPTLREIAMVWLPLAGGILLFAKYPIRLSYLIVALPFFALAVGQVAGRVGPALIAVFILASLSQNLVILSVAKPDVPGASTSGRFSPSLETGYLLADIEERRKFIGCDTLKCFVERGGPQPGPVGTLDQRPGRL